MVVESPWPRPYFPWWSPPHLPRSHGSAPPATRPSSVLATLLLVSANMQSGANLPMVYMSSTFPFTTQSTRQSCVGAITQPATATMGAAACLSTTPLSSALPSTAAEMSLVVPSSLLVFAPLVPVVTSCMLRARKSPAVWIHQK